MILFTFLQIIDDQYSLENCMNEEDASKWLSCEKSDFALVIHLQEMNIVYKHILTCHSVDSVKWLLDI